MPTLDEIFNAKFEGNPVFQKPLNSWEPSAFQKPSIKINPNVPVQPTQSVPVNPYYQDTMSPNPHSQNSQHSLNTSAFQNPYIQINPNIPAQPAQFVPAQPAQPIPVNPYYQDTISKAGEAVPAPKSENGIASGNVTVVTNRGRVDYRLEEISSQIDAELEKEDRDFEKLQTMIYSVIMLMMRLSAKTDHQNIHEIQIKIKQQAQEIRATYNTWQGVTVTVVSSAVSIGAGVMGLTPFMPLSIIAANNAAHCASAATSVASAGTGIGGLGSIINNRSEGNRRVYEIYLKQTQDTEDERKSSKHTKTDHIKTAKAARDEFARSRHEAFRAQ